MKILNETERTELLVSHRKERDKRIADRIKVVLLTDDGWKPENIAKALFIDDNSVRRHLEDFLSEKRLKPKYKGSEPILTTEESAELSQHVEENTYTMVKEIQAYILEKYKKGMNESVVYKWLKRNDFTYKKPKPIPTNSDPKAQEEFIKKYEAILTQASLEGDPVLFGDAVHPTQQMRPSYGWVKKGKDKIIETHAGRKRVNIMGALNLEQMGFVYQDFETINGQAAVEFLKKIEKVYPDAQKIHLIWDQAGYHTCQEVKDYLATSRVRVYFLPPRSPNLNSIERLWKVMHKYVSNNRCYPKFADFKKALFGFFDSTMSNIFDELVSSVTDNFRIINFSK